MHSLKSIPFRLFLRTGGGASRLFLYWCWRTPPSAGLANRHAMAASYIPNPLPATGGSRRKTTTELFGLRRSLTETPKTTPNTNSPLGSPCVDDIHQTLLGLRWMHELGVAFVRPDVRGFSWLPNRLLPSQVTRSVMISKPPRDLPTPGQRGHRP